DPKRERSRRDDRGPKRSRHHALIGGRRLTNVWQLFNLAGRAAIVTGGGSGLGRQFALALAEAGAGVLVAGRRLANCALTAERIRAGGGRAVATSVDVMDRVQVQAMADRALVEFGQIDILINNAGINRRHPVVSQPVEQWREVMETNVTGTVFCC